MTLGQMVTFKGQIDIGQVGPSMYEFSSVGFNLVALLVRPQSAVQNANLG